MKKLILAAGLVAALPVFGALPAMAADSIKVDTSIGCSFTIKLRSDIAPKHVAQITKLAAAGAYDNVVFHRVIDGFMAQTGDVQFGKAGGELSQAGMGGSKEPNIEAEFTKEHFARGVAGMARSQDPNSANSQFFVMFADGAFLDGQYTVWGKVDDAGMACVDKLKKGDPQSGAVPEPDSMKKVTVQ
jgi:cyclophilin family peptidyl-prolyl cis-trans isomerase